MRMTLPEQDRISVERDFFGDPKATAAHTLLMRQVFDLDVGARDAFAGRDLPWTPIAYFDGTGSCIASLETTRLLLHLDGQRGDAFAIRSVAVAPAWRGRGLFRALMLDALDACGQGRSSPILLYTGEPALYTRFGFDSMPQHAFTGAAPAASRGVHSRRLHLDKPADIALIHRAFAARTPVSDRCAVMGAASLFLSAVAGEDIALVHARDLEAIIAYELDDDTVTLVDIVAPILPTIGDILGALPATRATLTVLFPPDKLDCRLVPRADDNGLMSLGPLPTAMQRPFMLPPTTEF
jgi:predicted N-acetyltransferase YhbS